jgi:hypothetical protein
MLANPHKPLALPHYVVIHGKRYPCIVNDGVNISLPGLYEWKIGERGSYIGKYKRIKRPTREYGRNVKRLMEGKAYRLNNPDGFRKIHLELAEAHRKGWAITLIILENAQESEINRCERKLIADRGALNTPPYGRSNAN